MEHKVTESLPEEQQAILQEEQIQQEEQEIKEPKKKPSGFKAVFEIFSGATVGILSSICALVFIVVTGWCIVIFCETAYDRWFDEPCGYHIGQNGLMYVGAQEAIMKTGPNRKVLKDITSLVGTNDSTGIVCYKGKEGLLDLNTAQFVLPAQYDKILHTGSNIYWAVKQDTVYTIMMPGCKIEQREPTATFYQSIYPIYRDNDIDLYLEEEEDEREVLLYEYTDYTGRCGMMSKDLQKLTPAIYSCIEVVIGKEDVFLCHFEGDEYDEGVGELRNNKGEKIE